MNRISPVIKKENGLVKVEAKGVYYMDLNKAIREEIKKGESRFSLLNINGHRYLADGVKAEVKIDIHGVPGQDLGAFMNGPIIKVMGNAQDGVGNTMDGGKISIDGMAGDVCGYAMRGGKIHIRGDCGYRVGIHMKEYFEKVPVIIVGGKAGDFFGEYMAGGRLILLGMYSKHPERPISGIFMGTGMHGGSIFVRGRVEEYRLGKELGVADPTDQEMEILEFLLLDFAKDFGLDHKEIMSKPFFKYYPKSLRPYGNMYAY
jgi:glutamate synthase domain-containing protein 3